MKHRYIVKINNGAGGRKAYTYSFGKTKDIRISFAKSGVSVCFEMSVIKTPDDFAGLRLNLFRDALRKAYLLYAVLFDSSLVIRRISVEIDGTVTVFDESVPHFPFVFSMLKEGDLGLGKIHSHPDVIRAVLSGTKTSASWDEKNCALSAFMLSRSRRYEMDRFLNLWTAMNAMYNLIAAQFEAQIGKEYEGSEDGIPKKYRIRQTDNPSLGALICLLHPGTVFPKRPDDREEYKEAYKDISRLLQECVQSGVDGLYEDSLSEMNSGQRDGQYEKLYELADSLDIPLYIFLLLVYPYWLRCNYFHGSRTQLTVAAYTDPEYWDLKVINVFLTRFLSEHIPKLFGTEQLSEQETERIRRYLKEREKK